MFRTLTFHLFCLFPNNLKLGNRNAQLKSTRSSGDNQISGKKTRAERARDKITEFSLNLRIGNSGNDENVRFMMFLKVERAFTIGL